MEHVSTQLDSTCQISPTERRRHVRVPLETNVGLVSDSNFYMGFTENLSEGGLFICTYALKAVGTRVTVSFVLDDVEITAPGIVRWTREPREMDTAPGMGVQFEALSEEQEEAIRAFMAQREPMFFVG